DIDKLAITERVAWIGIAAAHHEAVGYISWFNEMQNTGQVLHDEATQISVRSLPGIIACLTEDLENQRGLTGGGEIGTPVAWLVQARKADSGVVGIKARRGTDVREGEREVRG